MMHIGQRERIQLRKMSAGVSLLPVDYFVSMLYDCSCGALKDETRHCEGNPLRGLFLFTAGTLKAVLLSFGN